MPNIDIPIPASLNKLFQFPPCSQVTLKPASSLKITLPTGGTLNAFSDLSQGIPSDCSLTFSLMLQLAPFLASIECLLKVLGLIGPLIEFVKAVPDPIKLASTVPQFLQAAEAVMPCVAVVTGFGIIPFIKDLLCLIIKALNCFLSQMQTLIGTMTALATQLSAAQANGDNDLMAAIQCEQSNSQALAGNMTASLEPIGVILQLAGTLFSIVGMQPLTLPAAGAATDLDSLNILVETIQDFVTVLQTAADALGGCGS
jgi:hypothetical protein